MSKKLTHIAGILMLLSLLAACGPSGQRAAETGATTAAGGANAGTAATQAPAGEATSAPTEAATQATADAGALTGETATAGATAAAGGTDLASLSGAVIVDGSSTVEPISLAVAEEFRTMAPNVDVAVGRSGTGGGFEKFCNGESDISDASRAIKPEESEACAANTIEPVELQVAIDALAVVTNAGNTFLQCLTAEQIVNIFKEGGARSWNEVDPSFPNEPIEIFAPGADSGTFDYFIEHFELRGAEEEEPEFIGDYTASEDDNVLVQGIQGSPNAIGFFGFSYYEANRQQLKAIQVDQEGNGTCVSPSAETVQDGTYPLARPLFIYPSKTSLQKPQVRAFVEFYMSDAGLALVEDVDYFPAPADRIQQARQNLADALR